MGGTNQGNPCNPNLGDEQCPDVDISGVDEDDLCDFLDDLGFDCSYQLLGFCTSAAFVNDYNMQGYWDQVENLKGNWNVFHRKVVHKTDDSIWVDVPIKLNISSAWTPYVKVEGAGGGSYIKNVILENLDVIQKAKNLSNEL